MVFHSMKLTIRKYKKGIILKKNFKFIKFIFWTPYFATLKCSFLCLRKSWNHANLCWISSCLLSFSCCASFSSYTPFSCNDLFHLGQCSCDRSFSCHALFSGVTSFSCQYFSHQWPEMESGRIYRGAVNQPLFSHCPLGQSSCPAHCRASWEVGSFTCHCQLSIG